MPKRNHTDNQKESIDNLLLNSGDGSDDEFDEEATNFTIKDTSEDDAKWKQYDHYYGMTNSEIKALLKARGLKYNKNGLKHELILVLMGESDSLVKWVKEPSKNRILSRFSNYRDQKDQICSKKNVFNAMQQDLITPIFVFQLLFGNIIDKITKETLNHIKKADLEKEMQKLFKQSINKKVIQCYLACCIIMGSLHTKSIDSVFRQDSHFIPSVASVINRKQYRFLTKNIRLVNNYEENQNKYFKVEELQELVNENFKKYNYPSEYITIDEGIIPTKNHALGLSQFKKDKPDKWGYKVYKLVDSEGYLYGFFLFTGKGSITDDGTNSKIGSAIVHKLVKSCNVSGQNHTLVLDNYFTTLELFEQLLKEKIYCIGTCRQRIGITPQLLLDAKLEHQFDKEYLYKKDTGILMMAINDSNKFYFIDSKYTHHLTHWYQSNKDKRTSKQPKTIPLGLYQYKHHMGAVDVHDQKVKDGAFYGHNRKWYMVYFWFLLESTILNAKVIYEKHHNTNISIHDFREYVIDGLIDGSSLRLQKVKSALNPFNNLKLNNSNKNECKKNKK